MHLPGGMEMIVLLVIVLMLFGGAKLPQLMKGMGDGNNTDGNSTGGNNTLV